MGTIGGLSSGTSGSVNMYGTSIKGYGGLASGLDTDSLIQGMTSGTRNKITELLRDKTKYQWQSDSYRSVSDKLVQMQNKYLELNNNSLARASFFDKNLVALNGSNSSYLSVAGSSKALDSLIVLGVGQLAKDTNIITGKNASEQSLNTGELDLNSFETISNLEGQNIKFKYGSGQYTISLNSGRKITTNVDGEEKTFETDFTTLDGTVESLNKILENTKISGVGGNLGDKIVAEKDGDQLVFKLKENADTAGNTVQLSGGTDKALKILGFMGSDDKIIDEGKITADGLKGAAITEKGGKEDALAHDQYAYQILAGKTMTFNYNGVMKEIAFPDEETLKGWINGKPDATPPEQPKSDVGAELTAHVQKELDRAYGTGKVKVTNITGDPGAQGDTGNAINKFSLSFETKDASSVLRIKDAGAGLMGENGLLGITYSTSNRLNTENGLVKSGLFKASDLGAKGEDGKYAVTDYNDEDGNLKLTINGVKIEGLTVESSISQVIRAINTSDAGVSMNYLETSDRFTLTATNHGEAGEIEFGPVDADGNLLPGAKDFGSILFGSESDYTLNKGQDATMIVEYEGGVQGVIKRDTNTFNLEGATITLKGTFGVNEEVHNPDDGPVPDGFTEVNGKYIKYTEIDATGKGRVSFTRSVDAEKVSEAVGSIIEEYNTIIKEVYDKITKKPDRTYQPLSDDEKGELSESEITKLEDKAKEGLLFNDPLLRSLSDKLRTVFTGSADATTLKNMGITVASSYAENGKIYFDEEKFKAALSEDSEKVKDIFTRPSVTDANGNTTDRGGISTRLKTITYEFANTLGTKGSLIKKAGSALSPLSENDNELKKMRDDIDDQVTKLQRKLQTELDRYTKQFSSLEQLISQMNSQSSWFSQMTG